MVEVPVLDRLPNASYISILGLDHIRLMDHPIRILRLYVL